ncbi:hypothetical protein RvY_09011-2 [Ramazzottius varieornatus]|uniref:Uncharacterized protein n=1 Tax=Ramazzottius varieornatus TaxID=947166 RepID=A0A1D1VAC4_RAMVA|nr:hypothetical protein RvY_09011-2 [Ramazzottius varieornatus]
MAIFDASSPKFTKKIYTSNSQKNVAVILAILFMLNIFYDIAFIIGEIVLFIQKGTQLRLPYSADDIGLDTVLLLLLVILDALRFSFGKSVRLTERAAWEERLLDSAAEPTLPVHHPYASGSSHWYTYDALADICYAS